MRNFRSKRFGIIILILFILSKSTVHARIRVRVMNRLGGGKNMNIHCQSRDDDMGYHVIPDGLETEWGFSVNFWGTTLFYCDVLWDNSNWHHFDAYSYTRDADRCQTQCIWMVAKDGLLYNFNQQFSNWDLMPFQDF